MLDTKKSYLFPGKLINSKGAELPVFVHLEYEEYEPDSLTCSLTIEDMSAFDQITRERDAEPRIVGELPSRMPISIAFFASSYTKWANKGTALLYIDKITFGHMTDTPFSSGIYGYSIRILNCPTVKIPHRYDTSADGEVTKTRDLKDAIKWSSALGNIMIANFFSNHSDRVGVEDADVQIETSHIIISNTFSTTINVGDRTAQIVEGVKDILDLLTLINRKYVHWYAIEASFRENEDSQNAVHTEVRNRFGTYKNSNRDGLFWQRELKSGLLHELVNAYHSSPIKSSIEKAIMYLAASYEFDKLEAKLLIAYSGYESIVNALSDDRGIYNCLEKTAFKKLRREILSALEKNFQRIEIKYPDDLRRKLCELMSRPISNRVVDLIALLGIETHDVWDPEKINVEVAVQNINKRRNWLIHDPGKVDPDSFLPDLLRVQALCERMILASLGFKGIKQFHPLAYNRLRSFKGVGY